MSGQIFSTGLPVVAWPPDPMSNPIAWDKIMVSGVYNPGLARVGEFRRKWDWDEKKGKGQKSSSLTFTGNHLARGEIELWLLSGPVIAPGVYGLSGGYGQQYTDLQEWLTFSKLFQYDPTKAAAPTAVQIYHPGLAMAGLGAFICEGFSNPVRVRDGDSLYKVTIALIEYAAPPPAVSAVATPKAATAKPPPSTNPPGAQPDPYDVARQKQIAGLFSQAQAPL